MSLLLSLSCEFKKLMTEMEFYLFRTVLLIFFSGKKPKGLCLASHDLEKTSRKLVPTGCRSLYQFRLLLPMNKLFP